MGTWSHNLTDEEKSQLVASVCLRWQLNGKKFKPTHYHKWLEDLYDEQLFALTWQAVQDFNYMNFEDVFAAWFEQERILHMPTAQAQRKMLDKIVDFAHWSGIAYRSHEQRRQLLEREQQWRQRVKPVFLAQL